MMGVTSDANRTLPGDQELHQLRMARMKFHVVGGNFFEAAQEPCRGCCIYGWRKQLEARHHAAPPEACPSTWDGQNPQTAWALPVFSVRSYSLPSRSPSDYW